MGLGLIQFVLAPLSALPALPVVTAVCACYPTVARGCMASAVAAMGSVTLTMDAHAIAQSK